MYTQLTVTTFRDGLKSIQIPDVIQRIFFKKRYHGFKYKIKNKILMEKIPASFYLKVFDLYIHVRYIDVF